MRICLHLLIVDVETRSAAATTHGGRWLLPVTVCDERQRTEEAVRQKLSAAGTDAFIVGQWKGSIGSDGQQADWLLVARVVQSAMRTGAEWLPLDVLRDRPALLHYQETVVTEILADGDLPAVCGPFGSFRWADDALAWLREIGIRVEEGRITPLRTGAFELVLRVETTPVVYLKGLSPSRTVEIDVTRQLAAAVPDAFPRTIDLRHRGDGSAWWLIEACPARMPVDPGAVVRRLAEVQNALGPRVQLSAGGITALPVAPLDRAVEWARDVLDAPTAQAVADACRRVADSAPWAWIPMDLDCGNVLAPAPDRVVFIDLDDSFHGPAPLAAALFARRLRDASLTRAWAAAWTPRPDVDWHAADVAAAALEGYLGWRRVLERTRRGEVRGATGVALRVLAARLRAVVHR